MSFKEMIASYGMSQIDISKRFGIPYRTVQSWCNDGKTHRDAPDYVISMIEYILSMESKK